MVRGDSAVQSDVLEDLSAARNYRRWVAGLVHPYLGDDPIEIGAGIGDYIEEWRDGSRVLCACETDPARLAVLQSRYADADDVTVRRLLLPASEVGQHSAAVAINVLEHIEEDVLALRSLARLTRPGGSVVIFVPAFEVATGSFDRLIGHVRRYRKRTLRQAAMDAGLQVEKIHYVNSVGLFAWIVLVRILGRRPQDGILLRIFDRAIVPVLKSIERFLRPPFGQSLFMVASHRPSE